MSEKGFRSPLEENKALIISTQKLYCSRWLWLWSQNVGLNSIVFLKTILWCSWCTLSNISCLRERRVRKNNINMILDVVESDRGLYSGWVFVDLLSQHGYLTPKWNWSYLQPTSREFSCHSYIVFKFNQKLYLKFLHWWEDCSQWAKGNKRVLILHHD
jgi:hypothetical protein